MFAAWRTSTYQPQPVEVGEPSTSQVGVEVLQRTVTTVPAAAARISVFRACGRSTPSWDGRATVRNPPTARGFGTGRIHLVPAGMSIGGATSAPPSESGDSSEHSRGTT